MRDNFVRPQSMAGLLAAAILVCAMLLPTATWPEAAAVEYPELGEVKDILRLGRPDGVAFLVMEHNEAAYEWVLPRIDRYLTVLREQWPDLPVAVVSHGDEMFSLLAEKAPAYAGFQQEVRRLVREQGVAFQVCGAYAALNDVDESQFADFVEVVPSAPTQITDYRMMGYKIVHLDLTW